MWQQVAAAFDRQTRSYDAWFVDNPVYAAELACLHRGRAAWPEPVLEIGVGPGRFARDLDIGFGVDIAAGPLRLAQQRGVAVCQAAGESLPFRPGSFGSVVMLFVYCFLAEPRSVLAEARRVLRPAGRLVLAIIPAGGVVGQEIVRRKAQGHPLYRHAHLRSPAEVVDVVTTAGFIIETARSTLVGTGDEAGSHACREGLIDTAGCVIIEAIRDDA